MFSTQPAIQHLYPPWGKHTLRKQVSSPGCRRHNAHQGIFLHDGEWCKLLWHLWLSSVIHNFTTDCWYSLWQLTLTQDQLIDGKHTQYVKCWWRQAMQDSASIIYCMVITQDVMMLKCFWYILSNVWKTYSFKIVMGCISSSCDHSNNSTFISMLELELNTVN